MPFRFSKSTDTEHEVQLEPRLISALWTSPRAVAGQQASFEVFTEFVGNGAPISISGRSEKGKKIGEITDTILRNHYAGVFDLPEDLELDDRVSFEVELKKNGLKGESGLIPAFPPIRVTNMRWSAEEARRGDQLTLSADVSGLRTGDEVTLTIYEHDQDGAHDRIVELPAQVKNDKIEVLWEYEYHEDTDELPTQEEMEEYGGDYNPPEYFFTVAAYGAEHGQEQESGLLLFKDWVEIEVTRPDGQPTKDLSVKIILPDGTEREEKLDESGRLILEDIPPGTCRFEFGSDSQS